MQDSIFTKIIKGEIPASKIYEDDKVLAFLDIYPDEEGHTLLVPKIQVDKLYDLDDATYSHLWSAAKKIARHYDEVLGRRVMFKVVGVDVPHAHIHIVPYDPVNHPQHADHQKEKFSTEPDFAALAAVAEKLKLT